MAKKKATTAKKKTAKKTAKRNEQINSSEIRLIDNDGSQIGIITIEEAIEAGEKMLAEA